MPLKNTPDTPLTAEQEKFCQLLIGGALKREAYLKAGFKVTNPKTAGSLAWQLLQKPHVKKRLETLRQESASRLADKVQELRETVGTLDAEDVFSRMGRAKALAARRAKLLEIVAARGADPEYAYVAGYSTGYVCIDKRKVGPAVETLAAVDTALLAELRHHEEQIARELGQWVEIRDDSIKISRLEDLPQDVLDQIIAQAEEEAKRQGVELPAAVQ